MCYICVKEYFLSVLFLFLFLFLFLSLSFVVDIFLSIEDVYKNTIALMVLAVRFGNLMIEEMLVLYESEKMFFFLSVLHLVIMLDLIVDFLLMTLSMIDDFHIV